MCAKGGGGGSEGKRASAEKKALGWPRAQLNAPGIARGGVRAKSTAQLTSRIDKNRL